MIYAENILICITIPLIIALFITRGNTRRWILYFLIGMGVCLLAAYINGFIRMAGKMNANDTAIFIAPIIEEFMKMLPLMLYLLLMIPKEEHVFLAAIGIGTGFATFENCCYILSANASSLIYMVIRGMAVGVMHVVSIFAMAIGLVMLRRLKVFSLPGIVGAIALAITFHGMYNLLVSVPGLSTYIGYAMPMATGILLYVPYKKYLS